MNRAKALFTRASNPADERISKPENRTKKLHKHSPARLKTKEIKEDDQHK